MAEHGQQPATAGELRTSLIATTAVIITVVLAIFLAAADSLQDRLPAPIRPVVETVVAGVAASATPAPAVTLPAPSPSPSASPTPAQTATPTATSSSMVVDTGCGYIPVGWVPYVVRPGDTLFHLSINSGATINEIVQANCLGMTVLTAGTVIYLPYTPPSRPPCGPPQWWVRYTVQRGDTLYSLALRHGTTVYAIMQANCLVSTYIQAGRQIFLPPLPASPVPTATATSLPPTAPPASPPPPPTATSAPPTATSAPPATATPTTTPTAEPSSTPQATPSATTVPSATPPPSPTATSTSAPTATSTPVASPTSTSTPQPSNTPEPSATPTNTPVP